MTSTSMLAVGLYFCACALVVHSTILTENIYAAQDANDSDVTWLIVVTSRNDTDDGQVEFECEVLVNSNDLFNSQLMVRLLSQVPSIVLEYFNSTNFGLIDDFLPYFTGYVDVSPSSPELKNILQDCNNFPTRSKRMAGGTVYKSVPNVPIAEVQAWNSPVPGFNVKLMGTKWCGKRIAKSFEDLGMYHETDKCCRTHAYCGYTMGPGETKYNITNYSLFPRSNCECENTFYDCLVGVGTADANRVQNIYFSDMKRPCFYEDYPVTGKCKHYETFLRLTCREYERDTNANKIYQWLPAPLLNKG